MSDDIRSELAKIRDEYPNLREDAAFVFWFIRAYLADDDQTALDALTGQKNDRNLDAIWVDVSAKQVHFVQGKFHKSRYIEKRNDVLAFAELAKIPRASTADLAEFERKMPAKTQQKLRDGLARVKRDGYKLRLYYVTTGTCSEDLERAAVREARKSGIVLEVIAHRRVEAIFNDYLKGQAPPVRSLTVNIASEGHQDVIHRVDDHEMIESWVFSMRVAEVGAMFSEAGIRIFASNIRGYLGETKISNAMRDTLRNEPSRFWYYNNGITIVCDKAERITSGRADTLVLERPQIINGQQTTRTLEGTSSKATVMVRVIQMPRLTGAKAEKYDRLVSSIVQATNWQNVIKYSDLVANDLRQIQLERDLHKQGYQYLRKRQARTEAARFSNRSLVQIRKEDLAQAVCACDLDPSVLFKGREILFGEQYYKKLFKHTKVSYYLPRYWLTKLVMQISRREKQSIYAYAKWLVVHFIWEEIGGQVGGRDEARFRYAAERDRDEVMLPLENLVKFILRCAKAYCKVAQSKEKQLEASAFFKQSDLADGFRKFVNSREGGRRQKLERLVERLAAKVATVELS